MGGLTSVLLHAIVLLTFALCSMANNDSVVDYQSSDLSVDIKSMFSKLLPPYGAEFRQQASQALQLIKYGFIGRPEKYTPSSTCIDHIVEFLQGVLAGEMWALKMIDAMSKPETGVLGGNFKWLGNYDECVDTWVTVNKSGEIAHPWKGQYCTAVINLEPIGPKFGMDYSKSQLGPPSLSMGVCLPNSCSSKDATIFLYKLFETLHVNATPYAPYAYCQEENLQYDTKAIVALAICSVFAAVILLATVYDLLLQHWPTKTVNVSSNYSNGTATVYAVSNGTDGFTTKSDTLINGIKTPIDNITESKMSQMEITEPTEEKPTRKPGMISKALLAFSVYTNGGKILNTTQPKGTLTAVNGIRFISMSWVILGHVYAFHLQGASNVGDYYPAAMKKFEFQAILNATVSVDTFFALSGLLVSYLSLREMKKRNGAEKFKWGMFYFHRIWRLTPPYMLFMMFYVCLLKYMYNGPEWIQNGAVAGVYETCEKYWWRNLLYINNLFPVKEYCMAWSWYLSNDMQFYIISPLMLVPLYYSKVLGTLFCLLFLAVYSVSSGIVSNADHLSPNLLFNPPNVNAFDHLYDKPWTRIGPYVVGVIAGYVLYRTNCKIRMPKMVNLIGWLLATGIALAVLYGLYDEEGPPHLSNTVSAIYNATSRAAWAVAVCWVIVACATGHGGFVNTLLSWKPMIPLSRLTYCAYLVHPVVMYFYIMASRQTLYFTSIQAAYLFLGHMCVTYAVSFFVSLAFESPMMGLEKALLGRDKNS